jgi:hypothetical protein
LCHAVPLPQVPGLDPLSMNGRAMNLSRPGRAGRGGPSGPGGAGWGRGEGMGRGDVPCWTVPWLTVFEPNGLCRFRIKNACGVVSRWWKKRGCGENRGGCDEKVQISGENFKTMVKIIASSDPLRVAGFPPVTWRIVACSLQGMLWPGSTQVQQYPPDECSGRAQHLHLTLPRNEILSASSAFRRPHWRLYLAHISGCCGRAQLLRRSLSPRTFRPGSTPAPFSSSLPWAATPVAAQAASLVGHFRIATIAARRCQCIERRRLGWCVLVRIQTTCSNYGHSSFSVLVFAVYDVFITGTARAARQWTPIMLK